MRAGVGLDVQGWKGTTLYQKQNVRQVTRMHERKDFLQRFKINESDREPSYENVEMNAQ